MDQFLDRAGEVFDLHGGVDAVLVEHDRVNAQPLEVGCGDLLDVLGSACCRHPARASSCCPMRSPDGPSR
jgi:hypothetical protein